jgi:ABC-type dipeptide/oligopeptide/nickel transport system permease subunit
MSKEKVPVLSAEGMPQRDNPYVIMVRRLFHHRSAQLGMFLLGILIFCAIFAKQIAPFDPIKQLDNVKRRDTPCIHLLGCPAEKQQHLMGIDGNSRDLFSRIIYGARLSLQIGIVTVGFAIVIGGLLGAIAGSGFIGGWVDDVIMRSLDVLMAFPSLLLAIAIVAVLGPGLINALLAIAIVEIPIFARVVRASVVSVREMDYVMASKALGASELAVLFNRILPNSISPLIVQGSLGIASVILSAAALSFLGLGAEFPTPEWGLMLGEERNSIFNAPHLVFFPGIAIMLTVLSFNLIGDGLRDVLDPRLVHGG